MPAILVFAFAPGVSGALTSGSYGGLFLYIMVALGFSFLCSVLEAILLSTTASHVELMVQRGSHAGALMQRHKENVERPISAILTLNTIAHTVGAAGAGAQAAAIFGSQYIGAISAVLTLLILVFSEIIPKTLGAVYWKQLNPFAAYVIHWLVILLFPAVWVFEVLTGLMRPDQEAPTVTRAELEVLAKISLEEGTLIEQENRIVRNLLHLHRVPVETVMTPRPVMMAFPQNMIVQEVMARHRTMPFSRIPIYDENIDQVVGYVLRHEIYERMAEDQHSTPLIDLCHEIHAVPETANVAQVLNDFITQKEHFFLVIDEYGGTAGVISLEDTIESLLGIEITDETDVVADLRKLAQQRHRNLQVDRDAIDADRAPPASRSSDPPETSRT